MLLFHTSIIEGSILFFWIRYISVAQRKFENQGLSQISALINDWENIIAYLEESKQRVSLAEKCGLFRTVESWWVWGWAEELQKNFVIYTLIYTLINLYPYFQLLKSPGRMYWKTILIMWQNIKARGLQNSQFLNSLVNWEKFGSTAYNHSQYIWY